jgi:hypothetical protein
MFFSSESGCFLMGEASKRTMSEPKGCGPRGFHQISSNENVAAVSYWGGCKAPTLLVLVGCRGSAISIG